MACGKSIAKKITDSLAKYCNARLIIFCTIEEESTCCGGGIQTKVYVNGNQLEYVIDHGRLEMLVDSEIYKEEGLIAEVVAICENEINESC